MTHYQIDTREWWVQRWLELLDSYRFKKRLERARNYAREGNVLSIDFQGAQVLAKVQGTATEPYEVSLSLEPFTDEDWDYIIETMSEKAIYSASLLAGEMPQNIEEVFEANGKRLFPFNLGEIQSQCSCPDKANPCKHIGAVYYQLGDRFSEDPFVLFQLRGRTKTQILDSLRQLRSRITYEQDTEAKLFCAVEEETRIPKTDSLKKNSPELDIQEFWKYDRALESSLVVIVPPPESKTVLDILGTIPLSSADAEGVKQYLDRVYQTVSQQAVMSALNQ